MEQTIRKPHYGSRSSLIGGLLAFLLLISLLLGSLFHQYADTVIENNKDRLMTIAQNVSVSVGSEISQTKQGLHFFVESSDFKSALDAYLHETNAWPLNRLALSYSVYYSQILDNMIIFTDSFENPLWKLKQSNYQYLSSVSSDAYATIEIWTSGQDDQYAYLSITVRNNQGISLCAMLDLHLMHERMLEPIKLGDRGYVYATNSEGLIIMISDKSQIGKDVVTGHQEKYPDYQLNTEGIKHFVESEKSGEEGSEIFESYWWESERPVKAKILGAYTPVQVDDGFLIISAIQDYNEVTNLVTRNLAKILTVSMVIFLTIAVLVFILYEAKRRQREVEKENRYLKELNQTLQTLQDNERVIFHQQRLQIIGTMTSGIAHELNNLLTPIMGYSAMLVDQMDEDNPAKDDVLEILLASQKAKDIIQQISALGKRNVETVYRYENVSQLLDRSMRMIANLIPANIRFDAQITDRSYGIFCNDTQIHQVLINLVFNAIAAIGTKPDGQISLTYSPMKADGLAMVCIIISDNGCGMSDQVSSQIFDPFYTTKSNSGGTGLGLSVAQNIISSHKGSITVHSVEGEGASFFVKLPLAIQQKESQSETFSQQLEEFKQPLRILLVDDSMSVLKVLQKGLRKHGMYVEATTHPKEALDLFRSQRFDLLITDDTMHAISGIALALKARQLAPAIPTIILTALLRKEVVEAKQSGLIASYLIKPITFDELFKEIAAFSPKSE